VIIIKYSMWNLVLLTTGATYLKSSKLCDAHKNTTNESVYEL
jgi:hypothetical protein